MNITLRRNLHRFRRFIFFFIREISVKKRLKASRLQAFLSGNPEIIYSW